MTSETPSPRSWNLIDLGAVGAVVLAVGGLLWSQKLTTAVARATGDMQDVTVSVDVRGVPAADAPSLLKAAESAGKVSIVIRNQPHGTVKIRRIIPLQRRLTILTPDGRLVSADDPNQKTFGTFDARFILIGEAQRSAGGGVVFGNQTIKIGAPVELEGATYRFGGSVTDVKVGQP
ncbi:MAG: DUF4330 domain-containing protein [Cyanobium sp.]